MQLFYDFLTINVIYSSSLGASLKTLRGRISGGPRTVVCPPMNWLIKYTIRYSCRKELPVFASFVTMLHNYMLLIRSEVDSCQFWGWATCNPKFLPARQARVKSLTGHIWSLGRSLPMPVLDDCLKTQALRNVQRWGLDNLDNDARTLAGKNVQKHCSQHWNATY